MILYCVVFYSSQLQEVERRERHV